MEQIITYTIVSLIFFMIGVSITRWVLCIDKFIGLQEEQCELLRAIAVKLGAVERTGSKISSKIKLKQDRDYFTKDREIISGEDLEREALSYPKE